MRNLKKFLALVLALMMIFSLMVTANAATSFNDDAEINPDYLTAAEVLQNLGIYRGDGSGNMLPNKSFTRAELAGIAFRVGTADTTDVISDLYKDYGQFTDVPATNWASGYINYAYYVQWVHGVNAEQTKFNPNGEVTGYEVLALLLQILGYGRNGEFTRNDWRIQAATLAKDVGIQTGTINLSQVIKRQEVAWLVFQALGTETVLFKTTLLGYDKTGNTLGQAFQLKHFIYAGEGSSEITAVNRVKNSATIQETYNSGGSVNVITYNIINAGLDWTDIGYSTDFWAVPNNNVDIREYTPVSTINLHGKNTVVDYGYTTTNPNIANTSLSRLWVKGDPEKVVDLDNGGLDRTVTVNGVPTTYHSYHVYFNGELLSDLPNNNRTDYWYDYTTHTIEYGGSYNEANGKVTITHGRAVQPANGLKIDLIDTDEAGEVETIVVTEYTVAQVTGIANDKNTGHNAIVRDYYYLTAWNAANTSTAIPEWRNNENDPLTVRVHKDVLITNDDLTVGDVVTYTVYNGDCYAKESVPTRSKLTRVNSSNLGTEISYVFDNNNDSPMYKAGVRKAAFGTLSLANYAQDYYRGNLRTKPVPANAETGYNDYLSKANIGKSYDVYTDPYGYIIAAKEPVNINNYLYVVQMDHSSEVNATTLARVVFTDGTVKVVTLSLDSNEWLGGLGDIVAGHVYAYTYNATTDRYILTRVTCEESIVTLRSTTTSLKPLKDYVDNDTQFIDVRKVDRTTEKVNVFKRSDLAAPITGAEVHYVMNADGIVIWAYVVDENPVTDKSKEFIVYQTNFAYKESRHTLEVLVSGVNTTVTLDDNEYQDVQNYGVGIYEYDKDGLLTYTAFPETWMPVKWSKGTMVITDGARKGESFYYGGNVAFWTLDIADGKVYDYEPYFGTDWYADGEGMAVVYTAAGTSTVSSIYVVYGTSATKALPKDRWIMLGDNFKSAKVRNYVVAEGYITDYYDPETVTVNLLDTSNYLIGTTGKLRTGILPTVRTSNARAIAMNTPKNVTSDGAKVVLDLERLGNDEHAKEKIINTAAAYSVKVNKGAAVVNAAGYTLAEKSVTVLEAIAKAAGNTAYADSKAGVIDITVTLIDPAPISNKAFLIASDRTTELEPGKYAFSDVTISDIALTVDADKYTIIADVLKVFSDDTYGHLSTGATAVWTFYSAKNIPLTNPQHSFVDIVYATVLVTAKDGVTTNAYIIEFVPNGAGDLEWDDLGDLLNGKTDAASVTEAVKAIAANEKNGDLDDDDIINAVKAMKAQGITAEVIAKVVEALITEGDLGYYGNGVDMDNVMDDIFKGYFGDDATGRKGTLADRMSLANTLIDWIIGAMTTPAAPAAASLGLDTTPDEITPDEITPDDIDATDGDIYEIINPTGFMITRTANKTNTFDIVLDSTFAIAADKNNNGLSTLIKLISLTVPTATSPEWKTTFTEGSTTGKTLSGASSGSLVLDFDGVATTIKGTTGFTAGTYTNMVTTINFGNGYTLTLNWTWVAAH